MIALKERNIIAGGNAPGTIYNDHKPCKGEILRAKFLMTLSEIQGVPTSPSVPLGLSICKPRLRNTIFCPIRVSNYINPMVFLAHSRLKLKF